MSDVEAVVVALSGYSTRAPWVYAYGRWVRALRAQVGSEEVVCSGPAATFAQSPTWVVWWEDDRGEHKMRVPSMEIRERGRVLSYVFRDD